MLRDMPSKSVPCTVRSQACPFFLAEIGKVYFETTGLSCFFTLKWGTIIGNVRPVQSFHSESEYFGLKSQACGSLCFECDSHACHVLSFWVGLLLTAISGQFSRSLWSGVLLLCITGLFCCCTLEWDVLTVNHRSATSLWSGMFWLWITGLLPHSGMGWFDWITGLPCYLTLEWDVLTVNHRSASSLWSGMFWLWITGLPCYPTLEWDVLTVNHRSATSLWSGMFWPWITGLPRYFTLKWDVLTVNHRSASLFHSEVGCFDCEPQVFLVISLWSGMFWLWTTGLPHYFTLKWDVLTVNHRSAPLFHSEVGCYDCESQVCLIISLWSGMFWLWITGLPHYFTLKWDVLTVNHRSASLFHSEVGCFDCDSQVRPVVLPCRGCFVLKSQACSVILLRRLLRILEWQVWLVIVLRIGVLGTEITGLSYHSTEKCGTDDWNHMLSYHSPSEVGNWGLKSQVCIVIPLTSGVLVTEMAGLWVLRTATTGLSIDSSHYYGTGNCSHRPV